MKNIKNYNGFLNEDIDNYFEDIDYKKFLIKNKDLFDDVFNLITEDEIISYLFNFYKNSEFQNIISFLENINNTLLKNQVKCINIYLFKKQIQLFNNLDFFKKILETKNSNTLKMFNIMKNRIAKNDNNIAEGTYKMRLVFFISIKLLELVESEFVEFENGKLIKMYFSY